MIVSKVSCIGKPNECHAELIKTNPNLVSVIHNPNDHILIMKNDYNEKGEVKKSAWSIDEENKLSIGVKTRMRAVYEREFV